MYKYSYKGQIHTAKDFYEARSQAGLSLPSAFMSICHYVVRIWQWDDTDRDYAVEVLNSPGHQVFNSHDEALVCYNTLSEFFAAESTEDLKMDLVQFHLGDTFEMESQVLIPPVSNWQW